MGLPFYVTWTKQKSALTFAASRSEGAYYVDEANRRYLDLSSTSFQASFGHSFAPIQQAMMAQIQTMPIASPKGVFPLKQRVAESLIEFLDLGPGKIFFTQAGAESVENALKMARQISNRRVVVSRQDSYHGATLGAMSITGDWRREAHATVDEWNVFVPSPRDDPDFSKAKKILEDLGPQNIAALFFETVSGTNGVVTGDPAWWHNMNQFRDEHGLFLVLDEVLCGFYRVGSPMGFQKFSQKPDFVCMAKALTGGYSPLGAVWTSARVAEFYEEQVLSCGLTNYAHPVGLAAADVVLKTLRDSNFVEQIKDLEKVFAKSLQGLTTHSKVASLRREGLLACLDVKTTVSAKTFLNAGLYVTCKENQVFLAPSFVTTAPELLQAIETLTSLL